MFWLLYIQTCCCSWTKIGHLEIALANLKRAFITYVRPLLEYASVVWSPSHIYLINEIGSVLRSFTKRLPGMRTLSYSDHLDRLELQTLEYRRLIAELVLCYNIVHGLFCINVTSFFTPSNNSSLRGHDFRFLIPISKLDIRRHFFAHRSFNAWNCLPASVVSATSVSLSNVLYIKLTYQNI